MKEATAVRGDGHLDQDLSSCYGLNYVPLERYVEVSTLGTCECDLT